MSSDPTTQRIPSLTPLSLAKPTITEKEMQDARVPLEWRDGCADILIELNKCRNAHGYLPSKCKELRHAYEKCQHDEYIGTLLW